MSNILQDEFLKLKNDLVQAYETSGKKVSGQWADNLQVRFPDKDRAELWGSTYLAGRAETKNGHQEGKYLNEEIEDWLNARGIKPLNDKMKVSGLAWAIAQKIHQEGTNKQYHLKIYEQVITPERMQSIIDNVGQMYVQLFIENMTAEIKILEKDK